MITPLEKLDFDCPLHFICIKSIGYSWRYLEKFYLNGGNLKLSANIMFQVKWSCEFPSLLILIYYDAFIFMTLQYFLFTVTVQATTEII